MEQILITIQAPIEQNICFKVTQLVHEHNCQIVHMQGQNYDSDTALCAQIEGQWNTIAKLESALANLGKKSSINLTQVRLKEKKKIKDMLPYVIETTGLNQPDIITHLCEFCNKHDLDILLIEADINARDEHSPKVLTVDIAVNISIKENIADLRENFLALCENLNIDGGIEPERH